MQPRPDPRRRFILHTWNTPPAVSVFDPTHHRATKALASVASAKKSDTASFTTPRIPEGASPSHRNRNSQAVIWSVTPAEPFQWKDDPDADGKARFRHADHLAVC